MHGFHHVANGCDEFNQLLFRGYEGQICAGECSTREEPHLQNLAEQSRMDRLEGLEREPHQDITRHLKLDPGEQSLAADIFDHPEWARTVRRRARRAIPSLSLVPLSADLETKTDASGLNEDRSAPAVASRARSYASSSLKLPHFCDHPKHELQPRVLSVRDLRGEAGGIDIRSIVLKHQDLGVRKDP